MQNKLVALVLGLAALTYSGRADTPGKHPRYVHARSELRVAQMLMRVHDDRKVMRLVRLVDVETERAIRELDRAAFLDQKDIDDRPHIDADLDRPGRFRKAMELLQKARRDISMQEDNPSAVGWRNLALRHVDTAIDRLRQAAHALEMDRLEGF